MNTNALKARLVLEGLRVPDFLEMLKSQGCEMGRSAFYRKMNGTTEFDRKEILAITEGLNLTQEEMLEIFFARKVS